MPRSSYSLTDLSALAQTTPRTVRYYVQQGLLPAPERAGPGTHYTDTHLSRLRLIKRLQREHLPLAEIRRRLSVLRDDEVTALAQEQPAQRPETALDYVRSVLDGRGVASPARWALRKHGVLGQLADEPALMSPSTPPEAASRRSQWDRISLTPDIELHIRRPLARHQNRQVERLIALARPLLEEETP